MIVSSSSRYRVKKVLKNDNIKYRTFPHKEENSLKAKVGCFVITISFVEISGSFIFFDDK